MGSTRVLTCGCVHWTALCPVAIARRFANDAAYRRSILMDIRLCYGFMSKAEEVSALAREIVRAFGR